jgi:predicted alpha/beta hydrolase family esterase
LALPSFRTVAHDALDPHAELVAHAFGGLEHLRAIRIAHDLNEAFAVAQVDEDNAAVVAAAAAPSRTATRFGPTVLRSPDRNIQIAST